VLTIQASRIIIEERRFRKDFPPAKLAALATSISYHGLWHPIHVKELTDEELRERNLPVDITKPTFLLVHGERRLRAIRDYLWPTGGTLRFSTQVFEEGTVPATLTDTTDPLKLEEAEFAENEDREPFTWQERSDATARLNFLRAKQAAATGSPQPTVADIALETKGRSDGDFHETTRREILVAPHLQDPEIGGAKSLDEAWKALKRREQAEKDKALAERVGKTFTHEMHSVVQADCVEWMKNQNPQQFDVICTDPPYGINAQDFGDAGGRLLDKHAYDDSPEMWLALMRDCAYLWYLIAKPQAHLYVCCDVDRFYTLKVLLGDNDWKVHRTPLINYKVDGNRVPWPSHGPQRKWEMVLFAIKGDRPVNGIFPDVFLTKGDDNLGHGAQKPVALFHDLLKRSVHPGDSVLDPFAGTGAILPAAHVLKCRATLIEREPQYYGIALGRLKQLGAQE